MKKDLQALVDTVVRESKRMGLGLNKKKTEVMITSKKNKELKYITKFEESNLKQVNKFKYLGTIITSDGRCDTEVRSRIGQAKVAFQRRKNIVCNKHLSIKIGVR